MRRILAVMLATALAGCAADLDTIGREPGLSPVGGGIVGQSQTAEITEVATLSSSRESWVGGNADFFRDVRAAKTGDLVTVRIAINDRASLNNSSNRSRKSSADAGLGLNYDVMGVLGADVNGTGNVRSNSAAAGQGSISRAERIDLAVAAIVTRLLPNGHMVIEGSQEVLVNFEQRVLTIAGVIRPSDIAPDNTISYEKIAEARISYGGRGRTTEVQQPRWGQQIWDRISPF